jgi:hypothetical protein
VQTIKWLSFGLSNALTRTTVHFFPSAGSITAPYPATYKLSIFGGNEIEEKRVVLEGARLSQPDGVRVEDVFPALASQNAGIYALVIEVTGSESRVDVQPSQCIVELASKGGSARFIPRRMVAASALAVDSKSAPSARPQTSVKPAATGGGVTGGADVAASAEGVALRSYGGRARTALIRDCFHQSSLIFINSGATQWNPQLRVLDGTGVPCQGLLSLATSAIMKPHSVRELSSETELSEGSSVPVEISEQSWGLVRSLRIEIEQPSLETGCFLLCREAVSRRPVSVLALGEDTI